jgi:putative ABC transport system permease protein
LLRNYLLAALRNILSNRIQSVIQVISLVIGITSFILIGLYTRNELSYDRFNEKFKRIYRLEFGSRVGQPTAPGHQIKQNFSEVENVVRLVNWHGKDNKFTVKYIPEGDSSEIISLKVENVYWCDSSLFDVFTFDFLQGDPNSALRDPNDIVLSESTAKRIFGDEDPIGKSIWGGYVTAIIKDLRNSHFKINILIPMQRNTAQHGIERGDPEFLNNYLPDHSYITFLLLPERHDPDYVTGRINEYFMENTPLTSGIDIEEASYSLRPLKDIYFSTDVIMEKNYCWHGNLKTLRIVITIAVFILLLAVINYVNLTTARVSLRAKEVGIRKVVGSSKNELIRQFLVESILISVFSFIISLVLIIAVLPGFNRLVATDIGLVFMLSPATWVLFVISVFLLGVASGLYPALMLTRFQPLESLYGKQNQGPGSIAFRRIMLAFQFFISIILVVGVLVVNRQLNFMKTAELGFNKDAVINTMWYLWDRNPVKRDLVKEELEKHPGVRRVAFSGGVMGGEPKAFPYALSYEGIKMQIKSLGIDPDFLELMEIDLLDGRNFSRNRPADYKWGVCLINETAVREFGMEEPVGTFLSADQGFSLEIIGVVEDVHFRSHHEIIEPSIYFWSEWISVASFKLEPHQTSATLDFIGEKLELLEPGYMFDYTFLEDTYNRQYVKDVQTARIVRNSAFVAILIACLGLFGLSSFMAVRRTKEIGIRKIMGASVNSLFLLLSREFFTWVTLSIILAWPLAWYVFNIWLQGFAYHTNMTIWIFVVAALIAFLVTILTVAWQSLKTARTNPVESLRSE